MVSVPPASTVLVSTELLDVVTAFQRGVHGDMRQFVGLENPMKQLGQSRAGDEYADLTDAAFAPVHSVLSAWYDQVGHGRVGKLISCLPSVQVTVVAHAIYNGNLAVLTMLPVELLQAVRFPLMDLAALKGHLKVVEYLDAVVGYEGCTFRAMDNAALCGHLDVVRYLHEHRDEGCSMWAFVTAVKKGNLDMVQFLSAHYPHVYNLREGLVSAARGNHLDVATYILGSLGHVEHFSFQVMEAAASCGHLAMVQLLHRHNLGCTTYAMDLAAGNNHLHIVQWLHEHRREGCTTMAMDRAAMRGYLDVVTWLHANRREGCTTAALKQAATNGHWEVVTFLATHRREGSIPGALDLAVRAGRDDMIAMLLPLV